MNPMEIMAPDMTRIIGLSNANGKTLPFVYNAVGYGAKGDGIADDGPAIQAAIDACSKTGGFVELPPGNYRQTASLIIGNGGGNAYSSYNNVKLRGSGSGVSNDVSNEGNGTTRLIWDGPIDGIMIHIKGAILNAGVIGIEMDCMGKAAIGLRANHAAYSAFSDLFVKGYTQRAYYLTVERTTAFPFGAGGNQWTKCSAGGPANKNASGWYIGGNYAAFLDYCRNVFTGCEVIFGGQTGSSGWELAFTDNNTFIECMALPSTSTGSDGGGKGLLNSPPPENNSFPQGNTFYNCALTNVGGASGIVGNWFIPYADDSSGYFPVDDNLHSLTYDGRLISGGKQNRGLRQVLFVEGSDAQSTTSTAYVTIPGMTQQITTKANAKLKVTFSGSFIKGVAANGQIIINIDSVDRPTTVRTITVNAVEGTLSNFYVLDVAAGLHTVTVRWKSSDANTLSTAQRQLLIEELY